ncbi:MAG: hypothetical protein AAF554_14590 [Bacteroidota bacterium]
MKYVKELMVIALMVSYTGFAQLNVCGKPVFSVEKAVCKAWYNRGEQLSSGWRLEIKVANLDEAVVLEEAYFRNCVAQLRLESQKGASWLVADFEKSKKGDEDNTFDLKIDEAVLSYQKDGKKRYCKIVDVKSEKPSFHQAMDDGKRK